MKENGICLCEYVAFAAIIDILFSSSKIAKLKRDEAWCARSEGVHKSTTKTCGCSDMCPPKDEKGTTLVVHALSIALPIAYTIAYSISCRPLAYKKPYSIDSGCQEQVRSC